MDNTKTPWEISHRRAWPFDIEVLDSTGEVVLSEPRYAHSSNDRTLDDVLNCVHFKHSERATAAAGNAAQVAKFETIVHAVNSLASHEARIAELEGALRDTPCPRPCNNRPDDFTVGQCVAAGECGCSTGAALHTEGE